MSFRLPSFRIAFRVALVPASAPGRRRGSPRAGLITPEHLEARHLLAATLVGRDTNDPQMREGDRNNPQWNMEKVMADVTWTVYTGQPTNVVAVMDYGLDYLHEDFGSSLSAARGQLWDRALFGADPNILASKRGRDEINDVDGSQPGKEGATKPNPGEAWGNHAAGIIGALTNNSLGVAGMNWSVQMLSSKVLQGRDPYNVPDFNLGVLKRAVDHIRYLRDVTPKNQQLIRSVAFGYSTRPGIDHGNPFPIWAQLGQQGSPGISDATKGILVTVPAGDFGRNSDVWAPLPGYYRRGAWDPQPNPPDTGNYAKPGSTYNPSPGADGYAPGSTDNVIVVGAVDENDVRWSGNSNLPRIDIYAPGVSVISVGDAGGVKYQQMTGTRQAAAHVAGAISLIYDAAAQHGKDVTYHEVRRAIIEGGDNIGLDRPRLNVVGALRYLGLDTRPNPGARGLSIAGGSAAEGDGLQSSATFKLTLSKELSAPLPVQVRIDDGTATAAAGDYVRPTNGLLTVVIPAGKKEHTFSVAVAGDRRIEADETFTATIVNPPPGLTIGSASATWTIVNDDSFPTVQLGPDIRVVEGTGGVTVGRIQVFLSKAIPEAVTATYSLSSGTATAGADFIRPLTAQTVVFRPNTTSQWINIHVVGDRVIEPVEVFSVQLHGAVNGTVGTRSATTVTITDDDGPVVAMNSAQVRALAGGVVTMTFTVTLSKPASPAAPVSIAYRAVHGTAIPGAAGIGDYLLPAGTLTFAAGERVKTILVTVQPRRTGQPYPKRFTLELSAAVNAQLMGGASQQTSTGIIS